MSLVAKSNITYQETATPLVKTNNVIMDGDGSITFTDPDGVVTLSDDKTVTGYRYVAGMPTQFNNGCIYDIGEISNDTNFENVRFNIKHTPSSIESFVQQNIASLMQNTWC